MRIYLSNSSILSHHSKIYFIFSVGVRLGEHNLDNTEDCDEEGNYCAPPTQDFYIEDIKVHPLYDSKTFHNDIALIRLATTANFSFCKYIRYFWS